MLSTFSGHGKHGVRLADLSAALIFKYIKRRLTIQQQQQQQNKMKKTMNLSMERIVDDALVALYRNVNTTRWSRNSSVSATVCVVSHGRLVVGACGLPTVLLVSKGGRKGISNKVSRSGGSGGGPLLSQGGVCVELVTGKQMSNTTVTQIINTHPLQQKEKQQRRKQKAVQDVVEEEEKDKVTTKESKRESSRRMRSSIVQNHHISKLDPSDIDMDIDVDSSDDSDPSSSSVSSSSNSNSNPCTTTTNSSSIGKDDDIDNVDDANDDIHGNRELEKNHIPQCLSPTASEVECTFGRHCSTSTPRRSQSQSQLQTHDKLSNNIQRDDGDVVATTIASSLLSSSSTRSSTSSSSSSARSRTLTECSDDDNLTTNTSSATTTTTCTNKSSSVVSHNHAPLNVSVPQLHGRFSLPSLLTSSHQSEMPSAKPNDTTVMGTCPTPCIRSFDLCHRHTHVIVSTTRLWPGDSEFAPKSICDVFANAPPNASVVDLAELVSKKAFGGVTPTHDTTVLCAKLR